MRRAALSSLSAAETELRELRSAGAVFGLIDVDDEFFVIVRPAPPAPGCCFRTPPRRWTMTLLRKCWTSWTPTSMTRTSRTRTRSKRAIWRAVRYRAARGGVLGVIVADIDMEIDEQISAIAERMGFDSELSAVLDKIGR